jgi:hypothetical protein
MLNYVKPWLHGGGIVRSGKSKTEFMIFLLQDIRNSRKNKNRQPIRAAVFSPPAEIYSVSFLTAHHRQLSFPIKGTLALHCQVARLLSESFLMLGRIVSILCRGAIKFCVIGNRRIEAFGVTELACTNDHHKLCRSGLITHNCHEVGAHI